MQRRGWTALAVFGLALAIGLVALALHASWRAGGINGPGTLVVLPSRNLLLGVDGALWRVAPDGRLLSRRPAVDAGLPGAPSNLVRHPEGLVATTRHDPTLYLLDAEGERIKRTLTLDWPSKLRAHADDAIQLAVAPDGRIAVATGGGHTVAMFDAQGRFLARTPPGMFRFTNGLWWDGGSLWTSDTNRDALRVLDGRTLALQHSLPLPGDDAARFIGPARAAPPAAAASAALIRLHNGMVRGRVALLQRDGDERALPQPRDAEPVDIDWLGTQLIASDGAAFTLRRWDDHGQALPDFGDASLREALQSLRHERDALQQRHRLGLVAGVIVFALAFVAAVVAQRAQRRQQQQAHPLNLSRLGTPQLSTWDLLRLEWRAFGWTVLPFLVIAPLQVPPWRQACIATLGRPLFLTSLLLLTLAVTALLVVLAWRMRRLSHDPAFEPVFNALALRKLQRATSAQLPLAPGEAVLETFTITQATLRWAVLTDRRLFVFRATLVDERPETVVALHEIAAVFSEPGPAKRARRMAWAARLFGGAAWLRLRLHDGREVAGAVAAPSVAERVRRHMAAAAGEALPMTAAAVPVAPAAFTAVPPRALTAFVSLLVPGAGQWWQRRPAAALLLFVPWLGGALLVSLPVLHTWLGSRADVPPLLVLAAWLLPPSCALLAAWDAWRMGVAPPRPQAVGMR
jgi:hypothetical protein